MRLIRLALLLPLTLALLPLPAAATADDTELLQAVHAFLHEQASTLGDELIIELRLPSARLPACESPEPFLARPGDVPLGRVSVGVRCGSDGRQVRYLQADIGALGEYPVLTAPLAAGETVRREHLAMQSGNLAELPNRTLLDIDEIVGQVATRPLSPEQPLQAHQFRSLPLVERNQRVVVEARGAAFRITREGQALEPGAMGDRVRVRFDSREVVTAEVVGEGTLVVDF
ncbi:flagellar basal body P-ring formation protein FlgA [Billgrantia sulfidoxydans]|uniref:Flagella basal body P-ring formation protein FlgA n=1 Tax=Billgrantia sulfidoxydans TaxID=2733484 RepID=A0ABX7W8T5_9GAMM|nr:flagellar basal body P-ring formation chaperone FlgA [Halomonas sulfidoxydans]QTP55409.1 flagellar basal body P-ring formation protein FlgA [Halomonas sulfidoxydans]